MHIDQLSLVIGICIIPFVMGVVTVLEVLVAAVIIIRHRCLLP